MTTERWRRISDLYDSVVQVSPAERRTVLAELCSDDEELRQEIESLLEARDEAGIFLSPDDLQRHICDLSDSEVAPSSTFGRYQIISLLGEGGMGQVYLAEDEELNRRVALKILPVQFMLDADHVARFRREARAASALNHPNIVTVYDVGQSGQTWFIATEFVEGKTLRTILSQGSVSLDRAVQIALECARGIGAAHHEGIIHRDVKPENILIRQDGAIKIVDFGLARSAQESLELTNKTRTGAVMGTPRYMSPEQARGHKIDARTDIFSLGAVLYEMVAGQPAFSGESTAEIFVALLTSEPVKIGTPLDSILRKALAKNVDERYPRMQDFAADLESFCARPGSSFGDNSREYSRFSRRAVLTGASILVAGMGSLLFRRRPGRHGTSEAPPMTVVPVTSFAGYKDYGSFSPDEQRIAFSWNGGLGGSGGQQERNIYVKNVGGGEPLRLTSGIQDETHAAWSPDSRRIAFCRVLDSRASFKRFSVLIIPANGGHERKIWEGGEGVSWAPDGRTLALAGLAPGAGGIFRFNLQTGAHARLTTSSVHLDDLPVFSPDGQSIVFTRSFGPRARELFVVPASGGTERQLTFDRQPTYGAAWTADSRGIVFSSNRSGGGESLWWMPANGGAARRLSATLEGAFYPDISRSGKRLLYTESFLDTNIYSSEGPGFAGDVVPGRFGNAKCILRSSRRDDSASIAPDGHRIAFVSRRTGNEEIWLCDLDGSHLTQLTSFRGPAVGTPRWSQDGNHLAFDSTATGNPAIYLVSTDGGAPRALKSGPSDSYMPSWSADGRCIYFKSDRSGSDQIWSVPADGGSSTQITRNGGNELFASPDGKTLYYTNQSWGSIWTVPAGGGPEKPIRELTQYDRVFRSWGLVDQGIYFISREDKPQQIVRFFAFATRQVHSLLRLDREPIWNYPNLALSPDGRTLLTTTLDHEVNDLMLVENFL